MTILAASATCWVAGWRRESRWLHGLSVLASACLALHLSASMPLEDIAEAAGNLISLRSAAYFFARGNLMMSHLGTVGASWSALFVTVSFLGASTVVHVRSVGGPSPVLSLMASALAAVSLNCGVWLHASVSVHLSGWMQRGVPHCPGLAGVRKTVDAPSERLHACPCP